MWQFGCHGYACVAIRLEAVKTCPRERGRVTRRGRAVMRVEILMKTALVLSIARILTPTNWRIALIVVFAGPAVIARDIPVPTNPAFATVQFTCDVCPPQ